MRLGQTTDNGEHDALPEHAEYGDPWPLLAVRCRLLDSVELTEQTVPVVAAMHEQLSGPLREALAFHAIRLHLIADALSAALADEPGTVR
jgi:hypothetical protein